MRFSSITIRAGMIVALGLFTGCSDQSSNINQLNQNEFALRGMIASDRQQIDALRADLHRTQDELAEMKHGGAASTERRGARRCERSPRETRIRGKRVTGRASDRACAGCRSRNSRARLLARPRRRSHRRRLPVSQLSRHLRRPGETAPGAHAAAAPSPRRPGRRTSIRKSLTRQIPRSRARRFIARVSMR